MTFLDRNVASPAGVVDGGLCIGCGVCALAFPDAVRMSDQRGFNVATQGRNLNQREGELFRRICPGVGYTVPRSHPPASPWGAVKEAHLAWAADPTIRHLGSSGGVLTALLRGLLSSGRVDAVIGITASATDPLLNESVVVRSAGDASELAGSRYAPASPFMALASVETEETVAVVGKPCDVAGLRALIDAEPDRFPHVLAYFSFFCGGTPARTATEALIQELGVRLSTVDRVTYRGDGWPGYFTVIDDRGEKSRTTYAKSWGEVLNKSLHDRCKVCQDSTGATADIVAADYWEVDERGYPTFDDREGQSLLLVRSTQGADVLNIASSEIVKQSIDMSGLLAVQPSQWRRFRTAHPRSIGRRLAGLPSPDFRGVARWRWWLRHPFASLREARGSFRRARMRRVQQ